MKRISRRFIVRARYSAWRREQENTLANGMGKFNNKQQDKRIMEPEIPKRNKRIRRKSGGKRWKEECLLRSARSPGAGLEESVLPGKRKRSVWPVGRTVSPSYQRDFRFEEVFSRTHASPPRRIDAF
ncbi:hypothetical protein KM043_003600 [Ampulex compressa]|nr:hypothetical protein KM043_003600 [Ampulex compressa]